MADIFDIDEQQQVEELIHPEKRKPVTLAYLFSIIFSLQHLRDLWLGSYKKGSTDPFYNSGTTYAKWDRAIWTDDAVYESQQNGNIGNDPTGLSNSSDFWLKVQDNYIGTDERVKYNGQIIILTYALNKHFRVNGTPRIYIVQNIASGVGFNIYVPTAVFTSLGTTFSNRQNRIFQFVNQYVPMGISFGIVTY